MKDAIEKSLGAQLIQSARLHRARTAQLLKDLGLFPGQERVLQLLATHDSLTMGDLAAALKVRPPTISKTIGRLSAQGLVARHGSDGDARVVQVRLTDEGRERSSMILSIWEKIEDEMSAELDGKDRRRLRKMLKRLNRNLSAAVGAESGEGEMDEDEDA